MDQVWFPSSSRSNFQAASRPDTTYDSGGPYSYQPPTINYIQEQPSNSLVPWAADDTSQFSPTFFNGVPPLSQYENNLLSMQGLFQPIQYPQLQFEQYQFQEAICPAQDQTQQMQLPDWPTEEPWMTEYQHHNIFQPATSVQDDFQLSRFGGNVLSDQAMPNLNPDDMDWIQMSDLPFFPGEQVQGIDLPTVEFRSNPNMVTLNSFQQRCVMAKQRAKAGWTAKSDQWSDKELLNYFLEAAPPSIRTKRRKRGLLPTPDNVEGSLDNSVVQDDVEDIIRRLVGNGF